MQTSVLQSIVLVTYGNAYLQGRALPENFLAENSTFNFCEKVDFLDIEVHGDHYHVHPFADDPVTFFKELKAQGVKSMRLFFEPQNGFDGDNPDWMMSGFVGGGARWLIACERGQGLDIWEARWETVENPVGDKIWHVSYGRIMQNYDAGPLPPSKLIETKQDLTVILNNVLAFGKDHSESFAPYFEKALKALNSDTPRDEGYCKDFSPSELLPLDAERMIAACQNAWVFGGMGSWNDQFYEGATGNLYKNLSAGLYKILLEAVSEAANTSA